MSDPQNGAMPFVLTPSERVFLFGDRFAKAGGMLGSNEAVLSSGAKVNSDDLAEKMIAAAFLACEQAGGARLEVRQGKAMFGLMKTSALHVAPGARQVAWPEGSLESWVAQGAAAGPKLVDLAQRLLGNETSYVPAETMFARLKVVLAGRGVLHAEEKKTLKVFSSVTYSLPEGARAAAEQGGTQHVQAMLDACRQQRPELWKDITQGIRSAIAALTASAGD